MPTKGSKKFFIDIFIAEPMPDMDFLKNVCSEVFPAGYTIDQLTDSVFKISGYGMGITKENVKEKTDRSFIRLKLRFNGLDIRSLYG